MEHLMKLHLQENMSLNDLELLLTHSLMERYLTEIDSYRNLNMNILDALQQEVIILFLSMLDVKDATLLLAFLR